jgi:hypothetical protein
VSDEVGDIVFEVLLDKGANGTAGVQDALVVEILVGRHRVSRRVLHVRMPVMDLLRDESVTTTAN